MVRYRDRADALRLVSGLSPALTAVVHGEAADEEIPHPLLAALGARARRVAWNGDPTGVVVSWAMHHGGHYREAPLRCTPRPART